MHILSSCVSQQLVQQYSAMVAERNRGYVPYFVTAHVLYESTAPDNRPTRATDMFVAVLDYLFEIGCKRRKI